MGDVVTGIRGKATKGGKKVSTGKKFKLFAEKGAALEQLLQNVADMQQIRDLRCQNFMCGKNLRTQADYDAFFDELEEQIDAIDAELRRMEADPTTTDLALYNKKLDLRQTTQLQRVALECASKGNLCKK